MKRQECRFPGNTPLARGTTLHQIVFQFKGSELVRLEQVAEERMP